MEKILFGALPWMDPAVRDLDLIEVLMWILDTKRKIKKIIIITIPYLPT